MKKIIIALVGITLAFGAQAQLRTSRTFVKTKSRTEKIIRVGLSINNFSGLINDKDEDAEGKGSKVGFDVDFGFNKYFGSSNLYWGMELGIGTRGCTADYYDYYDEKEKGGFLAYNVKYSPFTIGYKFAIGDMIKIDPHLGCYASYDFASSSSGDFGCEDWTKYDAGIQAGIGVWYGRFNLDFMYQGGFINLEPCFDWEYFDGGKTSNFLIRLGISF